MLVHHPADGRFDFFGNFLPRFENAGISAFSNRGFSGFRRSLLIKTGLFSVFERKNYYLGTGKDPYEI